MRKSSDHETVGGAAERRLQNQGTARGLSLGVERAAGAKSTPHGSVDSLVGPGRPPRTLVLRN